MVDPTPTPIPAKKVRMYRSVCRLEAEGATEGERAAAKEARIRLETRFPGLVERAKDADAWDEAQARAKDWTRRRRPAQPPPPPRPRPPHDFHGTTSETNPPRPQPGLRADAIQTIRASSVAPSQGSGGIGGSGGRGGGGLRSNTFGGGYGGGRRR